MASSSDWIEAVRASEAPVSQRPGWMQALSLGGAFVEGFPIARTAAPEVARPAVEIEAPSEPEIDSPKQPQQPDPAAEAFQRGLEQGRAETREHYEAEATRLGDLRLTFQSLDQAAMDELAHQLSETVIALCGEAIDSFAPDADDLLARCKTAAERLGSAAGECALHLHPDDLAALEPGGLAGWRTLADPLVERGGLLFEGPDGSVSDGPAEWRRAIAAAIRG